MGTLYDIKVCVSVSPRDKRDIRMHPPKNVLKLEVRKSMFRAESDKRVPWKRRICPLAPGNTGT